MKQFKQFGITTTVQTFTGDKIKIDRILNKTIIVQGYKIVDSKFEKGNGKCLHLQIKFNDEMRVVFIGSVSLMDQIEKVEKDDFPFETEIQKQNGRLEFT